MCRFFYFILSFDIPWRTDPRNLLSPSPFLVCSRKIQPPHHIMSGPHNPSIEAQNVLHPPPSWTDYEKSFVSQSHADCSSSRLTTPNTDMSTTPIQRGEEERRDSKQEDYGQGQGQTGSLENGNSNPEGDAALAQQLGRKKIVVIMTALCVCFRMSLVWPGLVWVGYGTENEPKRT